MSLRFPLTAKLLVAMLCIVAVPISALITVSLYLQRTIQQDTEQKVETTLELAMSLQEGFLNEELLTMEHVAAAVATDYSVVAAASGNGAPPDLQRFAAVMTTADMLLVVDTKGTVIARSSSSHVGDRFDLDGLVQKVIAEDRPIAYPALISADELQWESDWIREQVNMQILKTQLSTDPRFGNRVTDGLALVGLFPVHGANGATIGAAIAADLLNRDYRIVDEVAAHSPKGVPLFATIAMDGIRVTTNVKLRDPEGNNSEQRALGTVYSDVVMENLRAGQVYRGRALVVDQWQRTYYRPLLNYRQEVIAGPYVGIPEAYFMATENEVMHLFQTVALVGSILMLVIFAAILALSHYRIVTPIKHFAARVKLRQFDQPLRHDANDEIGDLATALNRMVQEVRQVTERVEGLAEEVDRTTEHLHRAAAQTAQQSARVLDSMQGSIKTVEELQLVSAQTVSWLRELGEAVAVLSDGARRQERSVQYTGRVAAEIANTMQEARGHVERTMEGSSQLIAGARSCLKQVAEFTAGMAVLEERLQTFSRKEEVLGLFQDPSDLLLSVASTAERIVEEIRMLALTIQENQARLGFIHEEMDRVGTVVADTADSTQRAGAGASVVIGRMEQMVTATQGIGQVVEETRDSVEGIAASNKSLAEMSALILAHSRELREAAERLRAVAPER